MSIYEELIKLGRKPSEAKIEELKFNLSSTDYQAIKFAEGIITAEEYEPIKHQRQVWRDEINKLSK